MKANEKLIDELKYYLHNFYKYGSWSNVEQINFLNLYAEYIFAYNNLKFRDDIFQFHFGGEDVADMRAVVYKEVKNKQDFFNIYLPKANSIHNTNQIKDKVKKQRMVLSGTDSLMKINFTVSQIYLVGHELQHVIQWLICDKASIKFDDFHKKLNFDIEDEDLSEYNYRKTLKEIDDFKNKHWGNADYLATAEKEAENKTVEYFQSLVSIILKTEQDQDFKDFLVESLNKMLLEKKNRKIENAIIKRLDDQLVKQFAKLHNFDKKSLESTQIP